MSEIPEFRFCLAEGAPEKFLPTQGEPVATGYDVLAFLPGGPIQMRPSQICMIPLGIKVFCPEGWWLELRPRSSSFAKKHLSALYGVIDESYEGNLMFACQYSPDIGGVPGFGLMTAWDQTRRTVGHEEPLGQLVPVKRQQMRVSSVSKEQFEVLCKERGGKRGAGGFGSTSGG